MNNRMVMAGLAFCSALSSAYISKEELSEYQHSLRNSKAYLTSNGHNVSVMIPMSELYLGKTTYLTKNAPPVTKVFADLISRSSGRISLQGLLNANTENMSFNKSAVYAQVSHLSEYLLSQTTDVSYAPVVVNAYEKNNNYGIWKIYPDDEIFLNLSLIID